MRIRLRRPGRAARALTVATATLAVLVATGGPAVAAASASAGSQVAAVAVSSTAKTAHAAVDVSAVTQTASSIAAAAVHTSPLIARAGTFQRSSCSGYGAPYGHYRVCIYVRFGGRRGNTVLNVLFTFALYKTGKVWGIPLIQGQSYNSKSSWHFQDVPRQVGVAWPKPGFYIMQWKSYGWINTNRPSQPGTSICGVFFQLRNGAWENMRHTCVPVTIHAP